MTRLLTMCLVLAAAIGPPGTPVLANAAAKTLKLEGMGYLKARKLILSYGWQPVIGSCQVDADACKPYPELDTCACCGIAPCVMIFVKQNRCLVIGTIGGPPKTEEADTVVTDVAFRPGDCSNSN